MALENFSTPKTLGERLKTHLRGIPGALVMATAILAMSALENSTHATENNIKTPTTVTKSLKTEKKIPQIAEENPQIYEFLDGKITNKDTNTTLWRKLKNKIGSVVAATGRSDDLSYYANMELLYRQATGKNVWENLLRAIEQLQSEHAAIRKLRDTFATIEAESIGDMNDAIISYYNEVGGNTWKQKDIDQWVKKVERERKEGKYTYDDVEKYAMKREKEARKEKQGQ